MPHPEDEPFSLHQSPRPGTQALRAVHIPGVQSRTFGASHTVAETQKFVEDTIAAAPGLRLEYFELVDGNTLQKITDWEETSYAVGCITVFCGEVRLIDNIKYKEPAAL